MYSYNFKYLILNYLDYSYNLKLNHQFVIVIQLNNLSKIYIFRQKIIF
jgi:hypothetical protein